MPEIISREAARFASSSAGGKLRAVSSGLVRMTEITGPATAAYAQNDTMGNRDRIPKGARILGALVSNGILGASVTMDVGLRNWTRDGTGTVQSATAVVAALAVATAQSTFNASGTLAAGGVDSVVTADAEPYLTLAGANPTDDIPIRVIVLYATP